MSCRSHAILLALALASGCSSEATLIVQVRTDLTPGTELVAVEVDVAGEPVAMLGASGERAWGRGVRVAELTLPAGEHRLAVRALGPGGVVLQRPVRIELSGAEIRVVTILLTRDCEGVECDDAGAEACLAGRCVPAECLEDATMACTARECETVADCVGVVGSACAPAECTASGACFASPSPDLCAADEVCSVTVGCVAISDGCRPPRTLDPVVPDPGPPVGGELCNRIDDDGDRRIDEDRFVAGGLVTLDSIVGVRTVVAARSAERDRVAVAFIREIGSVRTMGLADVAIDGSAADVVTRIARDPTDMDLARVDAGFALAWTDAEGAWLTVLDDCDLSPRFGPVAVASGVVDELRVSALGTRVALVWAAGGAIMARMADPGSGSLDPEMVVSGSGVSDASAPDAAVLSDSVLFTYSAHDDTSPGDVDLFARALMSDGALSGESTITSIPFFRMGPYTDVHLQRASSEDVWGFFSSSDGFGFSSGSSGRIYGGPAATVAAASDGSEAVGALLSVAGTWGVERVGPNLTGDPSQDDAELVPFLTDASWQGLAGVPEGHTRFVAVGVLSERIVLTPIECR